MHLLCPHCKNPIELVKIDPRVEITCTACGSSFSIDDSTTTGWTPGGTTVGRFKLVQEVGHGGFGTVFKAHDPELDRTVAVKVPRRGNVGEAPADVDRFLREARSVAQLRHANIVSIHEVGLLDGTPYLVSDFIEGVTLTDLLTARRPAPRETAKLIAEVADALHHAHQQGVVHRDVKPSNIMVRPDGSPVVMDFGLAKREAGEITMTIDGQVLGTPAYMSPEQARGEGHRVDGRSDIYSLGVILYLLLAGELPFRGNNRMLLHQVIHDDPKPPRKLNDKIPRDLETITLKAMAKEPGRRYAASGELAADLRRFLAGESIVARPVGSIERAAKWVRRNPVVTGATAAVVLTLLAGTVVSYLNYRAAETARNEEAMRVSERDQAIAQEQQRVTERDAALDNARSQLGTNNMLLAVAAFDNRQMTLARQRLDNVPATQRHYEWHYLRRRVNGGVFTMLGHSNTVASVHVSFDGSRIVTGSADKTAKVWDARTGMPLLELTGHAEGVTSVAFSPDGSRIVSGSDDRTAKVWDARTGMPLLELKGHAEGVTSVAFSPDGSRIVSGSDDKTAKVWDADTGEALIEVKACAEALTRVRELPRHANISWIKNKEPTKDLTSVEFSPRAGDTVHSYRMTFGGPGVRAVAFSPDGSRIVTGCDDNSVTVWDAHTGTPLVEFKGHTKAVTSVAFSPDGSRIVSGSEDILAKVWDARTGTPLVELKGHSDVVMSVAFSPDGSRIVTGGWDNSAKVWDARTGTMLVELKGHSGCLTSVAFSSDGWRIVTGSADEVAKVWDARTGTPVVELKGHAEGVTSVAFSPDGSRVVTGSVDKRAKVWDARTGTPLVELNGHTIELKSVAFSPDGLRIVTGSHDKSTIVWDAQTGTSLVELKGHTSVVTSVSFSPDGLRIVTGSGDKRAKVWDARTGTPLVELIGHSSVITSVAFSPDGSRIATGSWDKTAKVWDARTGTPLVELEGHTDHVTSVAFSPDGSFIVTGSWDNTARVWDARTGKLLVELKGHAYMVNSVSFSPDGSRIVTGSGSNSVVWEARTGIPLIELRENTGVVTTVAFSPDGSRIVTGNKDHSARLWDSRGGNEMWTSTDWNADELSYRLHHTRADFQLCREGFQSAREASDSFGMRFYVDRALSIFPTTANLESRNQFDPDPRLIARAGFHHPSLAKEAYDRTILQALATSGDRLAKRLVAQTLLRDGKPSQAIPLLFDCLLSRPITLPPKPPVEELLLSLAYREMNQPDEAKRFYRAATEWLDRPRKPTRAANVVTHAINPWNAIGEAFKPIDDPRHNTFDWESWHECDVFRAEVEKSMSAK